MKFYSLDIISKQLHSDEHVFKFMSHAAFHEAF